MVVRLRRGAQGRIDFAPALSDLVDHFGAFLGRAVQLATNQVAEFENQLLADRVIDQVPLLLALEEIGIVEQTQLFRNICLRGVEFGDNLVYRSRTAAKRLKNRQPGRLRENLEKPGNFFESAPVNQRISRS